MKVVFITGYTAAEFEEAAVIFILCDEDEKEIESAAEVVNLNDLNIYKNIGKNINLSFQYFGNKLIGFITLDNWIAEIDHNFKSSILKPNLLIVVSNCDIDVDMNIFDQAVEKLNIPIVFLNKDREEYLVVGAAYEIGEGYFSLDI